MVETAFGINFYKILCSRLTGIHLNKKIQFYFIAHQSHQNFNLSILILLPGNNLVPVIKVKRNLFFQWILFFHFLKKEITN